MKVMAIINPFNDNNHTNNNHIVITIYVILRRAMSIGNRYLHFVNVTVAGCCSFFVCVFFKLN